MRKVAADCAGALEGELGSAKVPGDFFQGVLGTPSGAASRPERPSKTLHPCFVENSEFRSGCAPRAALDCFGPPNNKLHA